MQALSKDPEQRPATPRRWPPSSRTRSSSRAAASPVSSGVRISIPAGRRDRGRRHPRRPRSGSDGARRARASLARAEDAGRRDAGRRAPSEAMAARARVDRGRGAAIAGVVRNASRTADAPAPAVARRAVPAASAPASPEPPVTVTERRRPIPSAGVAASPSAPDGERHDDEHHGAVATTASTATKDLRHRPPPTTPHRHRSPRPRPLTAADPGRRRVVAEHATTSNVGYGYLE